jgi:hypothetical protein
MAVIRNRGPVGRVRSERFGGGSAGSKFSGFVALNTSGLEKAIDAVEDSALESLLQEIGEEVIVVATPLAPVRTGELRDSGFVEVETSGGTSKVDFGFSANHAAPVEFGAGGFRGPVEPRPFLRPAYEAVVGSGKASQKIKERLGDRLRG